ncbi:hypothetical protein [Glaciibacter psychrotolerans]|uniref:Uncharacterized protein n=1 Tax=Glaciibacter psychrotolerans TaxID=670054 RepID=A0A7Z0EGJ4_9MICO|nr:hypothetical protein [Leifsonia psychrotolerans]NYJ21267.1 hypothetical protein [Leifsonia psychrotolerans]
MSTPESVAAQPEPILVTFGDIQMTEHWLVTPHGTMPLAGTQVFVADLTREEKYTPGWAIALAVIGFFVFLLGLLFLLVKETRTTGFMQITVSNGTFTYQAAEPVQLNRMGQLYELQNRANYARGLIARA